MKSSTSVGTNKTGLATSPALAAELMDATRETIPSTRGDARNLAAMRVDYAQSAEPAGTMPPPTSLKEAGKSILKMLRGQKTTVFLDKLGERLAFERSGVRLYEALLSKLDAFGSWPGGPSRPDLEEICADEREHFLLIKRIIEQLGSDPTAVTPSANTHAVLSKGLPALLGDPRTDLRQGLEAVLVAELVDNDCWENLIDLARALGQEELAAEMNGALDAERRHLRRVRGWITAALSREVAGGAAAFRREHGVARAPGAPGAHSSDGSTTGRRGQRPRPRTRSSKKGARKRR